MTWASHQSWFTLSLNVTGDVGISSVMFHSESTHYWWYGHITKHVSLRLVIWTPHQSCFSLNLHIPGDMDPPSVIYKSLAGGDWRPMAGSGGRAAGGQEFTERGREGSEVDPHLNRVGMCCVPRGKALANCQSVHRWLGTCQTPRWGDIRPAALVQCLSMEGSIRVEF